MRQTIQFCTARDGARIAYATCGSGAPLVKSANWLSHLEFDWQSPVWMHMLHALSSTHRLVRYDERGCGLSDWDVVDLSFDAWIDDLETVVDAAGLERFPLLGISQGAPIAIAYAVRHPDRVSHLVLHGGYARGRHLRGNSARAKEEVDSAMKLAKLGWGRENPAFRQFFTSLFIPDGTAEQQRWFNELQRVSTSATNAERFIAAFADIDVTDIAPRVRCPTLVLHPVHDAVVPFDEGRLLASLIPGARFVSLDSKNHLLLAHEPAWRRWSDEVSAFLPIAASASPRFGVLTARERDVLDLLAQGRDNVQIAAHLGRSDKTIRNHITSIFTKLKVENRSQAIVLARESGFGRTNDRPP